MVIREILLEILIVVAPVYFLIGVIRPSFVLAKSRKSVVWRSLILLIATSIAFILLARENKASAGQLHARLDSNTKNRGPALGLSHIVRYERSHKT